ncbi:MAG TPA: ABC transporter ATP-binding protein [Firmicutes bacterium]|nr:ABC transporter ATP-binding protein [Bacillota bacterium]
MRGGGNILIQNVTKVFANGNGQEIPALAGINLEVRAGSFISLLGPSGCGKSTLLRLLAGLEEPTSGSILVDEEPVEGPHYSRGLVFQDPTLFPWLTIEGNLTFGPEARGEGISPEVVEEFLELTGLSEFKGMFPYQLSGGMAQRAALARVLINRPVVLLLDEPLGALDAFTRMQMQDELYRIWRARRTTVILVTHDIDEAIYLSEQVVILTPRPARVQKIIDIPLGYPRSRDHPDFFLLRNQILKMLHLTQPEPEGEFIYTI